MLLESLRRLVLFDPHKLRNIGSEEIANRLRLGGYDRGEFLNLLLANRLASLGVFVEGIGIGQAERILSDSDDSEISRFLQPVNGVGPHVLRNFALLRYGTESK